MIGEEVTFRVEKDILWDNHGRLVTAFSKGDVVKGTLWNGKSLVAESTIYPGVEDCVPMELITIIE